MKYLITAVLTTLLLFSCSDYTETDKEECEAWNKAIDAKIEELRDGWDKISFETQKKIVKLEELKCEL